MTVWIFTTHQIFNVCLNPKTLSLSWRIIFVKLCLKAFWTVIEHCYVIITPNSASWLNVGYKTNSWLCTCASVVEQTVKKLYTILDSPAAQTITPAYLACWRHGRVKQWWGINILFDNCAHTVGLCNNQPVVRIRLFSLWRRYNWPTRMISMSWLSLAFHWTERSLVFTPCHVCYTDSVKSHMLPAALIVHTFWIIIVHVWKHFANALRRVSNWFKSMFRVWCLTN